MEEIREFTRDGSNDGQAAKSALNTNEAELVQKHDTLIAFGKRLMECDRIQCPQLSDLRDKRDALEEEFNRTVANLEPEMHQRTLDSNALAINDLWLAAQPVLEAQPNTVLIYTLVLKDKLWLLWAGNGGVLKSQPVDVGLQQLGETVLKFRTLLKNSHSNISEVKATGGKLFQWLVQPLQDELIDNHIENLVFALDRVTRYIPMSALFDGKKYLIERYTVSTILSAGLTDTGSPSPNDIQNTRVLALGTAHGIAGFTDLPNVPVELNKIVREKKGERGIYPGHKFNGVSR